VYIAGTSSDLGRPSHDGEYPVFADTRTVRFYRTGILFSIARAMTCYRMITLHVLPRQRRKNVPAM